MADEKNASMDVPGAEDDAITFTYVDENGNEVDCRVLYYFHADHNDKDYLVYSTGVVTDEGEQISAVRFNPEEFDAMARGEDVDVTLEPLTEEIEWMLVADSLKQVIPEGVQVEDAR